MKKKSFEEEIEEIVRRLIFMGWEMGKEQVKTPYHYTCDTDKGEKEWKAILKLHHQTLQEIIDEIEGERKPIEQRLAQGEEMDGGLYQAFSQAISIIKKKMK